MEPLLYLTHRLPCPRGQGDRARAYHLLHFLSQRYRVFLGCFTDDEADAERQPEVRERCGGIRVERLHPVVARLTSLRGMVNGEALTLPYYRNAALAHWVDETVREFGIRKAVVSGAPMAQYTRRQRHLRVVTDFDDVVSTCWERAGSSTPWPWSWFCRREGEKMLAFERTVAANSVATIFSMAAEAQYFAERAPEVAHKVRAVGNGVDAEFFQADLDRVSPYNFNDVPIVVAGRVDDEHNIDALFWFADEVLPRVQAVVPDAKLYLVGASPALAELARCDGVVVLGDVPDVRPFLQYARVIVAPQRAGHGAVYPILEAMAMARPVVVSAANVARIGGIVGREFEAAADAESFAQRVLDLLDPLVGDRVGNRARRRILSGFDWETNLEQLTRLLEADVPAPSLSRGIAPGMLLWANS